MNAKGFFYETDLKEYRNLMDGDRLDLYFNKGKMDRAIVSGKAQSTYFYVKKDRTVSGKNEATGDTIHILFDPKKNAVKSLRLMGRSTNASGRYIDMEKYQRIKDEAKRDSLARLDSLSGKSSANEFSKEEAIKYKKTLESKKLERLFNHRKGKEKPAGEILKTTGEAVKPAGETSKTEDAQ